MLATNSKAAFILTSVPSLGRRLASRRNLTSLISALHARRPLRTPAAVPLVPSLDMKTKIPVTVATGFLGSGKTTLINHILTAEHGKKIAVIENEYGEISIDESLVKQKLGSNEEIFELYNGCICCKVRGD